MKKITDAEEIKAKGGEMRQRTLMLLIYGGCFLFWIIVLIIAAILI